MLGNIVVKLGLDSTWFTNGINKSKKSLASFGKSMTRAGAAIGGVGVAMLAPFSLAISKASELEEVMQRFDVVFKDGSDSANAWGKAFAKEIGRSEAQVLSFMASSQDLLIPLGFETGAATEMSKTMAKLAIDIASFQDANDADVHMDLIRAMTGSGEVMKKYGTILSEASTKQELLNMGLDPKIATNAQKAQARFNIIMAGSAASIGDATRSAGSWANQMKRLGGGMSDLAATIGAQLLPILTPLLQKAVEMANSMKDWVTLNKGAVVAWGALGVALTVAGGLITTLGLTATAASIAFTTLTASTGLFTTALGLLVSPIGLVVIALGTAGAAFLHFSGVGGEAIGYLVGKFPDLGGSAQQTFAVIQRGLLSLANDFIHTFTKVIPDAILDGMKLAASYSTFGASEYVTGGVSTGTPKREESAEEKALTWFIEMQKRITKKKKEKLDEEKKKLADYTNKPKNKTGAFNTSGFLKDNPYSYFAGGGSSRDRWKYDEKNKDLEKPGPKEDKGYQAIGAQLKGSSAAFSAIMEARNGNSESKAEKLAAKELEEQKKQTELTGKLLKAINANGGQAGGSYTLYGGNIG